MKLKYKENCIEALEHTEAFWRGDYIDRPVVLCATPRETDIPCPRQPTDMRERWTDIDYLIREDEYRAASRHWLGEMIPSRTVMTGWCLHFGFPVTFQENTVWTNRSMDELPESLNWDKLWENEWFELMLEYTEKACRHAQGKYNVNTPPILPPNDILASIRGADNFLMDLLDSPEIIQRHLSEMRVARSKMLKAFESVRAKYFDWHETYFLWSHDAVGGWQSDVSCMFSSGMFKEYVVPELEYVSQSYDKIFYHLDGPGSERHLEHIYTFPKIFLIEWVPGKGNPHGAHWLDLYKEIQEMGKAVIVLYPEKNDFEPLIKELDPAKTIFHFYVEDKRTGLEAIEYIKELTRRYH